MHTYGMHESQQQSAAKVACFLPSVTLHVAAGLDSSPSLYSFAYRDHTNVTDV